MPSDLENNLIRGGVSPAAAKLISNAIDNAATGRLSIGRQLEDATPTDKIRLIDGDTRKYVLTNLDYPHDSTFRSRIRSTASQFSPRSTGHPYEDSQPAASSPTLNTPAVKGGKFVSVGTSRADDVAQAEVTLNIRPRGGSHARLDQATGVVDSVPISVEVEPKEYLEATVEERPEGTVIRIRLKGVGPVQIRDSTGAACSVRQIVGGVVQTTAVASAHMWTR